MVATVHQQENELVTDQPPPTIVPSPAVLPGEAGTLDWIDCGRLGWLEVEQTPPHWLTLPPHGPAPTPALGLPQVHVEPVVLAATVELAAPSESASGNPALAAANAVDSQPPPAPRLREQPFDRFLARLENRLNDPITARPTVRLTDRLSAGISTRHTQVDDTPEPRRPWPLIAVQAPEQLERLLAVHDAAWTAFEKAGNALGLRFEIPAGRPDCFDWIPAVERFFNRHATLPLLIDGLGPTEIKGWDQLIKAGADLQVYGLARGIPGLPSERRATLLEELTPTELRRAEAILHFYVGEVGAERVLFGSGLGRHWPVSAEQIHEQAHWFAQERPWLETASARFILLKNARRLAK